MIDFDKLPRFKPFHFEIVARISEWANAYQVQPEAIERQIPIAHVWCNANPKKAPKKDPVRFLNSWMRKAKEMGNLVSKQPDRIYKEPEPDDAVMTGDDFAKMKEAIRNARTQI